MILKPEDQQQLSERGQNIADILGQINLFTNNIKPQKIEKPCTIGNGIIHFNGSEINRLVEVYEKQKRHYTISAFIPASGAASRMFSHLLNYDPNSDNTLVEEFILNFHRFPFISQLKEVMIKGGDILEEAIATDNWKLIFAYITDEKGLNYSRQLKGMVTFHRYGLTTRTAFEEHIHEFLKYGKQSDEKCFLHFTISPQHLEKISKFLDAKVEEFQYEEVNLSYSIQDSSTDTIALTKENIPARDPEGKLVFRPGGHGALIHNLQNQNADIIFIKNIDNITTEVQSSDTIYYKKILAGLLIEIREKSKEYYSELDKKNFDVLDESLEFISQWFEPRLPLGLSNVQLMEYAKLRIDRPLRVCGMVKNVGEAGGGPFWVKDESGFLSKQIVEKSQVEIGNAQQVNIFSSSTHFNPVDIVCSIKNFKGERYNLENFVDYSSGFISEKFQHGHIVKALELPGLWNGSMAFWNTIFVEVPISTFNPAKTVNDLLRPGHQ